MEEVVEELDWDGFEGAVKRLSDSVRMNGGDPKTLLFRGQGNSDYKLDTTLERAGGENISFSRYYNLMSKVKPAVESFTQNRWDISDFSTKVVKEFRNVDSFQGLPTEDGLLKAFPSGAVYRFMVYLRHHGFPSPLLDWSASPYVAAFFAFREPLLGVRSRSIYVYCEIPNRFKTWSSNGPLVRPIGPYVQGHQRHFRQQSDYTICAKFDGQWKFHPHSGIFASTGSPNANQHEQDSLHKFVLSSTMRSTVLDKLNQYNLNAFSLFNTEETLMETMWSRVHASLSEETWIENYKEDGDPE
jgi:hypothetical protein